jgi:hypothetical protein
MGWVPSAPETADSESCPETEAPQAQALGERRRLESEGGRDHFRPSSPLLESELPSLRAAAFGEDAEPVTASLVPGGVVSRRVPTSLRADESAPRISVFPAVEVPTLETMFAPEPEQNVVIEHVGRYALVRELAADAFARVHQVRDLVVGREVVLRELRGSAESDDDGRSPEVRFVHEARLLGRLMHPTIPALYEVGRRQGGGLYYTHSSVPARTLAVHLGQPLDMAGRLAALPWLLAAADALGHAHARGIVHRRFSAEAVRLGSQGEVLVVSWERARVRGEPDVQGPALARELEREARDRDAELARLAAAGAPVPWDELPPELAELDVERAEPRTDVFALGRVLHDLLAGAPPVVLEGRATLAPELGAHGYPAELLALVRASLAAPVELRPRDARAFAEVLRSVITKRLGQGSAVSLRPALVRASLSLPPPLRQRRAWQVMFTGFALGVIAASVARIWWIRAADGPAVRSQQAVQSQQAEAARSSASEQTQPPPP